MSKNLQQRKVAVMEDITSIPTRGYNAFGKYHYATQADVWDALRPLLVQHGLALTINDVGHTWDSSKDRTHLVVEVELTNVDEPNDTEVVTVHGEANDKTDKGVSKARSNALKYWLLNTFLISTGDENDDADSGPQESTKGNRSSPGDELATVEQKKLITGLMEQLGYKGEEAIDKALVGRRYPKLAALKQKHIGGLKAKLEESMKGKEE